MVNDELPIITMLTGGVLKVYNSEDRCRLTDCCHAYSTFVDVDLVCKNCYEPVSFGEGDGSEVLSAE